MKINTRNIVGILIGVTALSIAVSGCSESGSVGLQSLTAPSAVVTVTANDVPLNPAVPPSGPALGTGTNLGAGAPNSCPNDRVVLAHNQKDNVSHFSVNKIAGEVLKYEFRVYRRGYPQVWWSDHAFANDGRDGRYQQAILTPGLYTGQARVVFQTCGAKEWGPHVQFSVDGVSVTEVQPAPPVPPEKKKH